MGRCRIRVAASSTIPNISKRRAAATPSDFP